ncbi:arylsulfatase [Actinomadura chibensis]|uniref:Arylsulfatase n=1 Tax=Actinomadura chibensis TaxID=392828 RepID=A0A5D0NE27_9ACTN|nr:arylsulfatase [Actinomadura chibensis]TYB42481.1 arylsulfatase [Actinomadura chibensis]
MTAGFAGRIGRTTRESRPSWPREPEAPPGAPNIVVVLVDDLGYSDVGPYGSEVDTPHLDWLAGRGVTMTNYHSAPVCSPARAALLTGINPHRAGYASVADHDLGFPNTAVEIADDVVTLPEELRAHGYATLAVGKWHLTRGGLMNDAASRHSYPLAKGFDRYYGTMEGLNSFFHPNRLIRDNSVVEVDDRGDGYYLTDDLTDQAISMIKSVRASGTKPFFLYFCHQAMHGPLGAKPADLAKYRGRYAAGWDETRRRRFARQLELGLFPPGTELPPDERRARHSVLPWADLGPDEQERYARYMEVYAAMVDSIDQSLGRLIATIEALGELDDTIIVFTSDNGGTMEAGPDGTRSYFSQFLRMPGLPAAWDRDVARDLDLIGGPRVMPHYPRGWGRVSNTPFRLYKAHTFAGGVRVPFIIAWPGASEARRGLRGQFQYVTDVAPTLLELAGVGRTTERAGRPVQEPDGVSFVPVLTDPKAPATRREQYSEYGGERGFYRDGWKILTTHDPGTPYDDAEWELYHVDKDPTESRDVSAQYPELRAEMAAAWEDAAGRNQVFPLDAGEGYRGVARRPSDEAMARPTRILPGTFTLERYRSARLIALRSFEVRIEIGHHGPDDAGVLLAHGDQGGGYQLHVEDGRLALAYNAFGRLHEFDAGRMPTGPVTLVLRAEAAPEFGWSFAVDSTAGTGSVPMLAATDPLPMLLVLAPFSGIDVGICRGGPVHWGLYERHRTFPYTGALRAVTYLPGERADYDPAALFDLTVSAARFED